MSSSPCPISASLPVVRTLRLATRGSALALWQAEMVRDLLQTAYSTVAVELVIVRTTGDIRQDVPLTQVAGKGFFVREIEAALLRNEADIAVHSAKDLPSTDPDGLQLAAFCERADPRDALVSRVGSWNELPTGALVATSAPRRIAQLKHARPDLNFVAIRGNVDTRLAKLEAGAADALVLACAGLDRLHYGAKITERLPETLSLPQVGQGCVAVQCRAEDMATFTLVQDACDHAVTRLAVVCERAFLALLGGGCTAPVAAHATYHDHTLTLTARIASPDGQELLTAQESLSDVLPASLTSAMALATSVYEDLLAQGAKRLLQSVELSE